MDADAFKVQVPSLKVRSLTKFCLIPYTMILTIIQAGFKKIYVFKANLSLKSQLKHHPLLYETFLLSSRLLK